MEICNELGWSRLLFGVGLLELTFANAKVAPEASSEFLIQKKFSKITVGLRESLLET